MRWAWPGLAVSIAACASSSTAVRDPGAAELVAAKAGASKKEQPPAPVDERYTDSEFGFTVQKPSAAWGFTPRVPAPDGGSIPLVITQPDKKAQVIVQVAPRVASAEEIGGDLRDKLDEHPDIEAGKLQVLRTGKDSGFGFPFKAEGERAGRVAVVEGGDRLFVVIGSWPANADDALQGEVNGIFESLHRTGPPKSGM